MSKCDSHEGLGKFLEGLGGSGGTGGYGRVQEDLGGSSGVLEGLGGSWRVRRIWKGPGGSGRVK